MHFPVNFHLHSHAPQVQAKVHETKTKVYETIEKIHMPSKVPTRVYETFEAIPYFKQKVKARRHVKKVKESEEIAECKKMMHEHQNMIYRAAPAVRHHGKTILNPKFRGHNPYRFEGSDAIESDDYLYDETVREMCWDPTPMRRKPTFYGLAGYD
ncbi:hypothetical protein H0H93_009703 [Arthromyces matolae]|nr:hypothetical protein H0H93_009703 [Arthromyces matolae]